MSQPFTIFTLSALVSLVIAESALETIPREVMNHHAIKNHAQRLGKEPKEILLDRSYHHTAIIQSKLESGWKRGRPDIIHFALMEALSTPLFLKCMLKVYVHTVNDKVIFVGDNLRIPKSFFRFEGLMIKLFRDKIIKIDEDNNVLLELQENITFERLIKGIVRPNKLIGLSSVGLKSTAEKVVSKNVRKNDNHHCAFVIGGFPKGHFSDSTSKLFNCSYSIGEIRLETHTVIARILYECEKVLNIY